MLPTQEVLLAGKQNPLKRIFGEICEFFRFDNYKEQRLPACQPVCSFKAVVPSFILASILLLATGIGLLCISFSTQSFRIDYTDCLPLYGTKSCAQRLSDWRESTGGQWPPPECVCWYKFHLEEPIKPDAYVYYGLKNYLQNHLHFVRSVDTAQFHGHPTLSHNCEPFRFRSIRINSTTWQQTGIVPCGTRANSLFNDTYQFWLVDPRNWTVHQVPLSRINIAWPVDKAIKNPVEPEVFRDFTNPPYWGNRTIWDLDPKNPGNNGLQNEALIVWMRVAAFPDFRKLYARIIHRRKFSKSIPSGQYYLRIDYNYPVNEFGGRKLFIVSNTNRWMGGPYFFLSILYLLVALLCIVWSVFLFSVHKKFGITKEELLDIDEYTPYFYDRNNRWRRGRHHRAPLKTGCDNNK